jgi:hypothetical protein
MEQLFEIVKPLGVVVDELKRHPDRIARVQFAQVADMDLDREDRLPAAAA